MEKITLTNGIHSVAMDRLTFGPNTYGEEEHIEKFEEFLEMYMAVGGTSVDTARIYSNGLTEEMLGRAMKRLGCRNHLTLTTKGGHPPAEDLHKSRLTRQEIFSDLTASLKALNTDYTDVFLLHRDHTATPAGEIAEILNEIVQRGYAKVCGVSNWSYKRICEANQYAKAHNLATLAVSQINFSYAETTPDRLGDDTLVCMTADEYAAYNRDQFPVMAFSAQAKGFFAKMGKGEALSPKAEARFLSDGNKKRLERVLEISHRTGISAGCIALLTLIQNPLPTSAIFSCRTKEQMQETLQVFHHRLTPEDFAYLSEIR